MTALPPGACTSSPASAQGSKPWSAKLHCWLCECIRRQLEHSTSASLLEPFALKRGGAWLQRCARGFSTSLVQAPQRSLLTEDPTAAQVSDHDRPAQLSRARHGLGPDPLDQQCPRPSALAQILSLQQTMLDLTCSEVSTGSANQKVVYSRHASGLLRGRSRALLLPGIRLIPLVIGRCHEPLAIRCSGYTHSAQAMLSIRVWRRCQDNSCQQASRLRCRLPVPPS